jgi:hypothetical protein
MAAKAVIFLAGMVDLLLVALTPQRGFVGVVQIRVAREAGLTLTERMMAG